MKQNNEALPGVVMGGGGTDGDGPGGEHHRLPEGPSGPQSGYKQMMPFETKLWWSIHKEHRQR